MKVLQSSIFRAICAIAVGALLVKYREQTVTWITITIGVIFFVSGLISCFAYFSSKRRNDDVKILDAQGKPILGPSPSFPIVGIGSIILGGLLALAPTLVTDDVRVAASCSGCHNQFSISDASRFARVGCMWWAFPP
jgi:uncharacterized membrane protein HdeD (DUF308 family)